MVAETRRARPDGRTDNIMVMVATALVAVAGIAGPAAGQPFYVDSQRLDQDVPGIEGAVETEDLFGHTLAVGDFDDDGHDDLAVGVPYEDVEGPGGGVDAGIVQVFYGTEDGLDLVDDEIWYLDTGSTGLSVGPDQLFGYALAVGDFDRDGYDDLAASAPSYYHPGVPDMGLVLLLHGSAAGLTEEDPGLLWQAATAIVGEGEANDYFGRSLAAGDLNADTYDDLVVGIPGEADPGSVSAGAVEVFYGSSEGISYDGEQVFDQGTIAGIASEAHDQFGSSLYVGRLNGDVADDLAIGVPREDIGTVEDAGMVVILYGSISGVTTVDATVLHQGTSGVPGAVEAEDEFGWSLAGARLESGSNIANLVVGVGDNGGNHYWGEGAVHVFPTHPNGPEAGGDIIQQDFADPEQQPFFLDRFGWALAVADIDHDGDDDLAVSAPGQRDPAGFDGTVHLYYGDDGFLDPTKTVAIDTRHPMIDNDRDEDGFMGYTLAFGDFDGNGSPDLVVGTPMEDFESGPIEDGGVVHVLYAAGPDAISLDGYESGNTTAWQ